ncbi:hypothetical protein E8E13_001880 [Curvularia kusanoi]|uniref:Uncharacterized protein n=1 Tax=Curvularia kusanoi TaxID=90978 RepID=A0A9P4TF88_CURKU|nr:hypothetical protein E8E13_001880 [Curvularia kusanoi]
MILTLKYSSKIVVGFWVHTPQLFVGSQGLQTYPKPAQILLGYYQDPKLGLDQLELLQRDIEITFEPDVNRRIHSPKAQDLRKKVKQVHAVLMRITSMLPLVHLPNAISAIFDQDEICLLDKLGKAPETDTSSCNHPTYARLQSCRRRLQELIMAYDEDYDNDVWDEIKAENKAFAAHMSRLCDKTNEVLKRFPELTGHEFEGALSITPLHPFDEARFCNIVTSEFNDCLKRTQIHRMLDQAMDRESGLEFHGWAYDHLRGGTGVNHTDVLGRSVLHLACQKGFEYGVTKLLADGANPSIKTVYGSLPLHYAAANGFASICEMLLQHMGSEELDAEDDFGMTALDYAEKKRSRSVQNG